MRSVLLGLLLINILYWVWSSYVDQPADSSVAVFTPGDLPSLEFADVLVTDIEEPADDLPEPVVISAIGTTDVIDIDAEVSTDPLDDLPITVTPQEPIVDTVQVESETPVVAQPAVTLPDSSAYIVTVDPIKNPAGCHSVGPFLTLKQANQVYSSLNEAGLNVSQRAEEAEVWVGHWVHLPSYPSRAAAVQVVERLRREGVKDIYIEPSGGLANTVSLGLFSDLARAEIRAGKLRKLDIRPQIADRHREGLVYWVDMALEAGFAIDLESFEKAPNQTLKREAVDCQVLQANQL